MESISSQFSSLNPFAGSKHLHDDEDQGEEIDTHTLAGGGRAGKETRITHQLRVSSALRNFLVEQKVLSHEDARPDDTEGQVTEALRQLLDNPHAVVPPELTDRSHLLPDYFISSSHNTYLLAHQLYGSSSAEGYKLALQAGSRCVEIDAWDGPGSEPLVTHGYTLTSKIAFRTICETIRDVVDQEAVQKTNDPDNYFAAPIFISLENHCNAQSHLRLVEIMTQVFGDRLLTEPVVPDQPGEHNDRYEHVKLADLESKIVVIVEYFFPPEIVRQMSHSSHHSTHDHFFRTRTHEESSTDEDNTAPAPSTVIIPELAALGIYAQSVKPPNNTWFENGIIDNSPPYPLINISESGLMAHLPTHCRPIALHNAHHLMRVYPKGTRIASANLNPVPFWAVGAQICALNWQTFGASIQLNEALFSGTDGYVLKPDSLRHSRKTSYVDRPPHNIRRRLRLHVAGATDIPIPQERAQDGSDIKPYLTCSLFHSSLSTPIKHKTSPYRQHMHVKMFHSKKTAAYTNPPNTDPIWNEVLEWEYDDDDGNELVFLRMLIKSDDAFAANPKLVVSAVRLLYLQKDQWVFVRMLNLKGQETRCSLLVRFEIENIPA